MIHDILKVIGLLSLVCGVGGADINPIETIVFFFLLSLFCFLIGNLIKPKKNKYKVIEYV